MACQDVGALPLFDRADGVPLSVRRRKNHCSDAACWALVGPTASGKSAVALELARRHPVEIVSVDSMQVYRGMDIGTAKPTAEERRQVPHHMVDVLDPGQSCNVGRFCRMAHEAIEAVRARGKRPLLVGGSPLYLKGLIWGLMEGPGRSAQVRDRLQRELDRTGSEALHRRLARLDPEAARRIHPNDVQRLVRALEVCELTGERITSRQAQFAGEPQLEHRMVGLRWSRAGLYERIEVRVDRMMEAGLLAEVESLRGTLGPQARQALGYRELLDHLEGLTDLEEAVALIKRNTRRFARHQLTWLRHFPQARWVDATRCQGLSELVDKCEASFGLSA